jgi:GTPase SAR1 family protein
MANSGLSHQVDVYNEWKNRLRDEIANYKSWLGTNNLASDDVAHRLKRGMDVLKDDHLTIAFVGEYSRGKTELINALIFSEYGQRMLPSQAGRTTMCPTELFYDRDQNRCYIKLLPIETRLLNRSISDLKLDPEVWHEFELDTSSPQRLSESLYQVASTRSTSIAEARSLGFDESMLEADRVDTGQVIIPLWRHALVSLDNPLLKKGLNILDTPGLNALGSEPELTINMIPKAQAVIFLLSADSGVTASDMAIWNDYINVDHSDHRAGRFAVLNKIDVLWDDLQGEKHTAQSIARVREDTATKLGMSASDVIPLSAKQGLIGRIRGDDILLQRSAITKLEKLISKRILAQKEALLHEALVKDIGEMLHSSQSILTSRLKVLKAQYQEQLDSEVSHDELKSFADSTHEQHDEHYRKLLTLRSSRRLMHSQGEILQQLASEDVFNSLVNQTRTNLQESWSTIGMKRAMEQFFVSFDKLVDSVCIEAQLADKMVGSIYQRFQRDPTMAHLHPKPFSVKRQRQALKELKLKAKQFRRNPKVLVTEQTILVKRFFNSFVQEARLIHLQVLDEARRWPDEALLPLLQFSLEQKKLLESQVAELKSLASNSRSAREQQDALKEMVAKVERTIDEAKQIERRLCEAPIDSEQSLVRRLGPVDERFACKE